MGQKRFSVTYSAHPPVMIHGRTFTGSSSDEHLKGVVQLMPWHLTRIVCPVWGLGRSVVLIVLLFWAQYRIVKNAIAHRTNHLRDKLVLYQ